MLEWLAAGVLVKVGAVVAGWTRLRSPHALARAGYCSRLGPLLAERPWLVRARDRRGETPLMHAARAGQRSTVRLLLDCGADPNALCERRGTALMRAAELGDAALVSILIRAGANVSARDAEGATALHLAAGSGDFETVCALIDAGADRAVRDRRGRTPLALAESAKHRRLGALLRAD